MFVLKLSDFTIAITIVGRVIAKNQAIKRRRNRTNTKKSLMEKIISHFGCTNTIFTDCNLLDPG